MVNTEQPDAASNLDWLTAQGFFGKKSTDLLKIRDDLPPADFFFATIKSIYEEASNTDNLNKFVMTFMDLFTLSLRSNAEETTQTLTSVMVGTKLNPEFESLSSYSQYVETIQSFKNNIENFRSKQTLSVSDRISLAKQLLTVYDEGYEFDMKLFTFLLALLQSVKGKPVDISKNYGIPSSTKLDNFKKLDDDNHFSLLWDGWDKRIRNAGSHLNLRYDIRKNLYVGKNVYKTNIGGTKKTIVEEFTISVEELLIQTLPRITNFMQGFLVAVYLLLLSKKDQALYQKATQFLD